MPRPMIVSLRSILAIASAAGIGFGPKGLCPIRGLESEPSRKAHRGISNPGRN
jgi:hypothetical protein